MPKIAFYNTTLSFAGSNIAVSSVSLTDSAELADVSDTGSEYVQRIRALRDRQATATVYATGNAPLTIGATGNLTWSSSGAPTFPAIVESIQYGNADIKGAIPITITFRGNGS
jgi:hypothetical protein